MAPPQFKNTTRDELAKRANYICSNPECRTVTSAPAISSTTKAIVIGEAAHIYGARAKSARYNVDMTDRARADITNGIWLCGNCHKTVDDDPLLFPADMLLLWHSIHEKYIFEQLGKQNAVIRRVLVDEEIESFGKIPKLAMRIISDQPKGWEYRLTSVLLPYYLSEPERRWDELSKGLYTKSLSQIEPHNFIVWMASRNQELLQTIKTLNSLLIELKESWGAPGEPGNAKKINRSCQLLASAANRMVDWEEDVKFVLASNPYDKIPYYMAGAGGHNIHKFSSIRDTIDEGLAFLDKYGDEDRTFTNTIEIDLPKDWETQLSAAIKTAHLQHERMIESGELLE